MTTLAVDRRVTLASRALAVTRLQLTTNPVLVGLPVLVLAAAFAVNLLVFTAMGDADARTGGLASIYFTQLAMAWVGVYQNFSFTVGLNVTRRAFYLASLLAAALQSVAYGLVLYLASILERASGGWGSNMLFFSPTALTASNSPMTFLVYAVPMLLLTLVGLFLGAVAKRFGTRGFFLLAVVAVVVVGSAAALITYLDGWGPIVAWLSSQSQLSLVIGWTLVPTVLAAVGGWFVLRRAVP